MKMKHFCFLLIFSFFFFMEAYTQKIDAEWVKKNYAKREVMIPMRDGTRLFTAIYEPVSGSDKHPILITRTPYKAGPYGLEMSSMLWNSWSNYSREGYILIIQDVRGRWMSEGQFVDIRPFNAKKKKKTDVDEASDAYDTVDWLIKHIKNNNGRVGFIGTSYPGFYAMMAALSNHPAVRAICTGAPVTDWFMGDDIHHHGALMLTDAFHFLSGVGRPRPVPVMAQSSALPFYQTDEYSFFLKSEGIKNLSSLLGDSIKFWNEVMQHPNYDSWWQARNVRPNCYNIKPAVLVVGGTFDAEDCYGTLGTYKTINQQSPQTKLNIILGPWAHGKWNTSNVNSLGNIYFGGNT
ncbi:MAG: CocE/NonD family hydrolase, partial [Bacteroidota bacterium]|nr:CocE/NonD family hydrolase [Bacteroidota bacterium]